MRKRNLTILIAVLSIISFTFILAGCNNGNNEENHTAHDYNKKRIAVEYRCSDATCEEKATYYYSCSCGKKGDETFEHGEPLGHLYSDCVYNNDNTHTKTCERDNSHVVTEDCFGGNPCYGGATCEVCSQTYGVGLNHTYVDGSCKWCNATEGILFSLINDNTEYAVSDAGSNCQGEVVIPAVFNHKPVTSIASNAFKDCTGITAINIPNSITSINNYAFENCSGLVKIVVPESVTSIGLGAFKGCNAIEDITLPFIGASIDATYYDAVFGYIFGYVKQEDRLKDSPGVYSNVTNEKYPWSFYISSGISYDFKNYRVGSRDDSLCQYSCCCVHLGESYQNNYYLRSYYYYIPTTIKNVTITKQTAIPVAGFNNCDFIENITIPIETDDIGNYAFQNCNANIKYA